jgi:hypothetical protein
MMIVLRQAVAVAMLVGLTSGFAFADGFTRWTDATGGFNGLDGTGGAFVANTDYAGPQGFVGKWGGPGAGHTSFLTFCLEKTETINLGGLSTNPNAANRYFAKIGTSAVGGGGGAQNGADPLSSATAVLYSTFRSGGSIGGYVVDGGTGYGGSINDPRGITSALQHAIWRLEGEQSNFSALSTAYQPVALAMYNWALEATDGDGTADVPGFQSGALGNVRVLNLYARNTSPGPHFGEYNLNAQSQLTVVPTPTATLAGASLFFGIAAYSYLRHQTRRECD